MALDHLEEQGGTILCRLREDLQQIAVVVSVDEDLVLAKLGVVLVDLSNAVRRVLVIGVRSVEKQETAALEVLDGRDDVAPRSTPRGW